MIQSINGDRIVATERDPGDWIRSLIRCKRDSPRELNELALLYLNESAGFSTEDLAKAFGKNRGQIFRKILKAKKRLRFEAEQRLDIESKCDGN
ncbi:hypothetical protein [Rubinisphaera italica]|uniref:Uncharacterized protein n=1 Tax=Rubinisphaera italica TaxID=2527969 RepID=A0A5C5XKE6_9PLAN|nr:hypothetical protein [Rubinisphaera italica]TWT63178.1 hypothetical protein Pan54_39310 [Rubinisphaera italica]